MELDVSLTLLRLKEPRGLLQPKPGFSWNTKQAGFSAVLRVGTSGYLGHFLGDS